jgi:hypothetical protein
LVTLVSSTCMKATTITDSVMAHFCAAGISRPLASAGVVIVTSRGAVAPAGWRRGIAPSSLAAWG